MTRRSQSYHLLLSSTCRNIGDPILANVSLGGLPVDIKGTDGGVGHPQVPDAAQGFLNRRRLQKHYQRNLDMSLGEP